MIKTNIALAALFFASVYVGKGYVEDQIKAQLAQIIAPFLKAALENPEVQIALDDAKFRYKYFGHAVKPEDIKIYPQQR